MLADEQGALEMSCRGSLRTWFNRGVRLQDQPQDSGAGLRHRPAPGCGRPARRRLGGGSYADGRVRHPARARVRRCDSCATSSGPKTLAASANIGVLYLDSKERGRLLLDFRLGGARGVRDGGGHWRSRMLASIARRWRRRKIDEELRTASQIQQALLPRPRRDGRFYRAVGASVPSRTIGGDFFDYLDLSGDGVSASRSVTSRARGRPQRS